MVSRYLYKRIDSNNITGHKAEFIALLGISIGGIGVTGYYIYRCTTTVKDLSDG
jgi:hypothetical protein